MSLPVLVKVRGVPKGSSPGWDQLSYLIWDKKYKKGSWYNIAMSWEFEVYSKRDIEREYVRWIEHKAWVRYQVKIENEDFNFFDAKTREEFIEEVWYRVEMFEAFYDEN